MAKKGTIRRKQLTSVQIKSIAELWDTKTPEQIAEMLGSTTSTINNFAREIRKQNPKLCSARGGKGIKRKDLVATALAMMEDK